MIYSLRLAYRMKQGSTDCVVAGTNYVFASTPGATIHLLNHHFKSTRSWKAHDRGDVRHIRQIPSTSYLLTLSEDLTHEPELRVWNLDVNEKKTGNPKCLCSLIVQNGRKNFPVTAFTVTSDLTQLAVGFGRQSW